MILGLEKDANSENFLKSIKKYGKLSTFQVITRDNATYIEDTGT